MKVILAGYSKTGTKTMCAAFNLLGYNTYDFMENYYYGYKGWEKIFRGTATSEEIRETFNRVDALTDTPVFYYWEELLKAFPDAKIIFTTRDEDSWYKSLIKQIHMLNQSKMSWFLSTFAPACWLRDNYQRHMYRFLGDFSRFPLPIITPHHEKLLRGHYRDHNANVLKKAPKDQLLVYKVSEGWAPLCEFLGVEIPDQPFPHKNKAGDMIQEMAKSNAVVAKLFLQAMISMSTLAFLSTYLGLKFIRSETWFKFRQFLIVWFVKRFQAFLT